MPPRAGAMDSTQVDLQSGSARPSRSARRQVLLARDAPFANYLLKANASHGLAKLLVVFFMTTSTLLTLISTLVYTQELYVPQTNLTGPLHSQANSTIESDTLGKQDDSVPEEHKQNFTVSNKILEDADNQLPTSLPEADSNYIGYGKLDEDNEILFTTTKPAMMKYRRQANADWWTKLASSATKAQSLSGKKFEQKAQGKRKLAEPSKGASSGTSQVYKEQPLSQNAILTIRNQLDAIRTKHKTLVTKSIYQLYQLDNKLVDSYKLCLKKKMPLYAGMLYRTRDFVVRMGKDVGTERKVLEGMTKQLQNVLKQRMTNRTLVREYRRLIAAEKNANQQKLLDTNSKQVTLIEQQSSKVALKEPALRIKKDSSSFQNKLDDVQSVEDLQLTHYPTTLTPTYARGVAFSDKRISSYNTAKGDTDKEQDSMQSNTNPSKCSHDGESNGSPARKSKPVRYTVHVNEVNLKKELNKAQSLINRINSSSHELNSVVDDIVTLFKLNEIANRKSSKTSSKTEKVQHEVMMSEANMSLDSKKMLKKMLKSPARIYYEKYGKLTSFGRYSAETQNGSSDSVNTTVLPDLKPMFNSSSFVYPDMLDLSSSFELSLSESVKDLDQ